jgi:AcrR family transcriptional regulator
MYYSTEIVVWVLKMDLMAAADPRRSRILDHAEACLLRWGFDRTTMLDIAKAAHVSKATLYGYWSTKDALMTDLIRRASVAVMDDWLQGLRADEDSTLRAVFAHGFRALQAHPLLRALYTRDFAVLGAYLQQQDAAQYAARYQAGLGFVQALQQSGAIRADLSAATINHILLAISMGLATIGLIYDPAAFPALEDIAATLGSMMEQGLAPYISGDPAQAKESAIAYFTYLRSLMRGDGP